MVDGGRTGGHMVDGGRTGGHMVDGGRTGGRMMDGGRTGGHIRYPKYFTFCTCWIILLSTAICTSLLILPIPIHLSFDGKGVHCLYFIAVSIKLKFWILVMWYELT
jgi:hypothetical protein